MESDGRFACACGKVVVGVVQPKSSTFVTPTAGLCQCTDCYSFASKVATFRKESLANSFENADALTPSNAIDMRQIYKSDAIKMAGEEFLQGIKLREDSPCIRYYSTCCGTPLMMDYTMAPFFLVFQHTIVEDPGEAATSNKKENPFARMTPTVVLNHQSAPPDSAPTPEGIPVKDGVPLFFMSHAIVRAIFGMLGGKKGSSIAPQLEKVPVGIGVDAIGKKNDDQRTDE